MNNRLSGLTDQVWLVAGLAFVIGAILGWLVLGWVLFPVQYTDAEPWDLNKTAKANYVAMVADSYSLTQDINLARERLRGFDNTELSSVLATQIEVRNNAKDALGAKRLIDFAKAYQLSLNAPSATPRPTPATTSGGGLLNSLALPLIVLVLLTAAAVIGLLAFNRFRPQFGGNSFTRQAMGEPSGYDEAPMVTPAPAQQIAAAPVMNEPTAAPMPRSAPPQRVAPSPRPSPQLTAKSLGTFAATYKFGDDNYDTSFTLETNRGEFLGECGMGISDTVGDGKPDKVTAFDLWLFDKTDVRTVTQILMSENAYNDQAERTKLAPKGELTLAEKGKHILLETATLRVDAEIVDLVYASTPGLPPNSHFQKLIVEMVPTQK